MNKHWIAPAAIAAALLAAAPLAQAQAEKGNFIVRARAVYIDSANKDSTGLGLSINNKTIPELDISYFLSPNLAMELILTYPQKQTVNSTVVGGDIGTFKHLPPTLLLQYHFLPTGKIRPYVGAGGNLTLISKVDLNVPGVGALDLENSSVGGAAQVGADVQLAPGFFLNLDAKKVMIRSDVLSGGSKVSAVKVDPWLLSVGIGRRF